MMSGAETLYEWNADTGVAVFYVYGLNSEELKFETFHAVEHVRALINHAYRQGQFNSLNAISRYTDSLVRNLP